MERTSETYLNQFNGNANIKFNIIFVYYTAVTLDTREEHFIKAISHSTITLDLKYLQISHKVDSNMSIDDLMKFAIINLMHIQPSVRIACAGIIDKLAQYFIDKDTEQSEQNKQILSLEMADTSSWHLLHKFSSIIESQNDWIKEFLEQF